LAHRYKGRAALLGCPPCEQLLDLIPRRLMRVMTGMNMVETIEAHFDQPRDIAQVGDGSALV
jgi:hypothetical protein